MEDSNASAFSCPAAAREHRLVIPRHSRAVGRPTVDLAYRDSGDLQPKTAGLYLDRTAATPEGLLHRAIQRSRVPDQGLAVGAAPGAIPVTTNTSRSAERLLPVA